MKLATLFEDREPLSRGPIGDWIAKFGATPADIAEARKRVVASPEYDEVMKHCKDVSSPRQVKQGTICFEITIPDDASHYDSRGRISLKSQKTRNLTLSLYINGRISLQDTKDFRNGSFHMGGRYPLRTPMPEVIEGNPVESITRAMVNSLHSFATRTLKIWQARNDRFDASQPGLYIIDFKKKAVTPVDSVEEMALARAIYNLNHHDPEVREKAARAAEKLAKHIKSKYTTDKPLSYGVDYQYDATTRRTTRVKVPILGQRLGLAYVKDEHSSLKKLDHTTDPKSIDPMYNYLTNISKL